jgi:hypothetical protein
MQKAPRDTIFSRRHTESKQISPSRAIQIRFRRLRRTDLHRFHSESTPSPFRTSGGILSSSTLRRRKEVPPVTGRRSGAHGLRDSFHVSWGPPKAMGRQRAKRRWAGSIHRGQQRAWKRPNLAPLLISTLRKASPCRPRPFRRRRGFPS